ncbi:MAG: PD-(D/E)XK nuclease family protein [Bdellovibrionales bacterium]
MLKIRPVYSISEKRKILEAVDPGSETILVADLRSKFEWQNHALKKQKLIQEEAVFRPNDFWSFLSKTLLPDYRVVGRDFMLSFLKKRLKDRDEDWAKTKTASQSVIGYIQQFVCVFSHPNGNEMMREWFLENTEAFQRWGHWYLLAQEIWEYCLEEKILLPNWISGLLVDRAGDVQIDHWDRKIYIDLGLNIEFQEAEFFAQLSDFIDIEVLVPVLSEKTDLSLYFEVYRPFLSKDPSPILQQLMDSPDRIERRAQGLAELVSVEKYSNTVMELKSILSKVRKSYEQGIALNQMGIVAADIGDYWGVLKLMLEREGIPAQRPSVGKILSLPSMQVWLAEMQIGVRNWLASDLELSLFSSSNPEFSFTDFKRLYNKVYSHRDISRSGAVEKMFQSIQVSKPSLSRDEFLLWSLSLWNSEENLNALEQLLKAVLAEVPSKMSFSPSEWTNYFKAKLGRMEQIQSIGSSEGLVCIDLSSTEYVNFKEVFFIGIEDSCFQTGSSSLQISLGEVASIRSQTGFPISPVENQSLEYEFYWSLTKDFKYHLSFSASNLSAEIKGPSLIWLKEKTLREEDVEELNIAPEIFQDQNQLTKSLSVEKTSMSSLALERDIGRYDSDNNSYIDYKRFSASKLEEYLKCPFKFAARSLFGLQELPDLDLDIDRMKNGSIIHRLFELILKDQDHLGDLDLAAIVDQVCQENKSELGDQRRWSSLKTYYLKLAQKFQKFEIEWRNEFPKTNTISREKRFEAFFDLATEEFSTNETESCILITGVIDRIDGDGSHQVVIDYKSSKGDKKNHPKWKEEGDLQLSLYTAYLEFFENTKVNAAAYYSLKPWLRSTGFQLKSASQEFLPAIGRKTNGITEEEKEDLIVDAKTQIQAIASSIQSGDILPQPRDIDLNCKDCDWRRLCRAPHFIQ